MEEELKRNTSINKSQLLKQVKGFSSFLNNSASYWTETFNDLEKNLCQCPDNQQTVEINKTDFINKNEKDDLNFHKENAEFARSDIDKIFTDKRIYAKDEKDIRNNPYVGKIETLESFHNNLSTAENVIVKSSNINSSNKINYVSTNALSSGYNSNTNPYNSLTLETYNKNITINNFTVNNKTEAYKNNNIIINNKNNNKHLNFRHNNNLILSSPDNLSKEIKGLSLEELTLNANLAYLDPKKNWTKEEDEILINFINKTNGRNWKKISAIIKTKTAQQCSSRFNKIFTLKNKTKFSRNEDIFIIELIEKYGLDWDAISKFFPERKKEQIAERYFNKLNPALKRKEFEADEDALLTKLHNEHGNNWSEIAKHFKDASVAMLKNRFYFNLKKKKINSSANVINNNNNSMNSVENINFNLSNNNFYFNKGSYYSENSDYNSYEQMSNSLQEMNKNNNQNKIFNENIFYFNNFSNEDNRSNSYYNNNNNNDEPYTEEYYRNSNKSYEPMNYKARTELMNEINKIKEQENLEKIKIESELEIQNGNRNKNIFNKYNKNNDSHLISNSEPQSLSFMDYEEFLKDFGKAEKIPIHAYFESFNKENLNESDFIESVYNSNIDYNSTSLLDLLDEDIFSIDFFSRTNARNSGESILNLSYYYNNNNNNYNNNYNNLKEKNIKIGGDCKSENIINSFDDTKYKFFKSNFNEELFAKQNFENVKEENKYLFEDRKMIIDDYDVNEIMTIPQNFTNVDNNSPKKSNLDLQSKITFDDNYNKFFNQKERKESFSKTNSNEIKEKIQLNTSNDLKNEKEANERNKFDLNKISKTNNFDFDSLTKDKFETNNINKNENTDKYLIKHYKLLQDIYRKYKKYKNFKIKIKNESHNNNLNDNLNKVLAEVKNLNEKSESFLYDLISLRKDYKYFAKNLKNNKKQGLIKQANVDPLFLRNSLLKQIDLMMKLIRTIKEKIDLIRKYNNKFTVINGN